MCPQVRVHVRLGSIRLQYEGDQDFYEAQVEALLEAAATGRAPTDGAAIPRSAAAVPTVAAPTAAAPAIPASPASDPAPGRDGRAPWTPRSAEFGRYIRRLGPEAAESDRQVVAFAFYLWNYERQETFGRAELEGCFKALHLPTPEPLEPVLDDLTERKRFLERAGDGVWRLSKKGENYVKTRLLTS
jgi:hypothetical protein